MTISEFLNRCQATWGKFEGDPATVAAIWRDALSDVRPEKLDAAFRYLAQESKFRPKPADVFHALAKLGNEVSTHVTAPPGWEPVMQAMGEPFWKSYLSVADLSMGEVAEIVHPLRFTADILKTRYVGEISRALGKRVVIRSVHEKRQDDRVAQDRAECMAYLNANPEKTVWDWLGIDPPNKPDDVYKGFAFKKMAGAGSGELKAKVDNPELRNDAAGARADGRDAGSGI